MVWPFPEMSAKSVPRGRCWRFTPATPPSIAGRAGDRASAAREGRSRSPSEADVGVVRTRGVLRRGPWRVRRRRLFPPQARERPLLGDRRARVDLAARGSTPTAFPAFHSSPGSEDDDPSDDRGVSGARMVGVTKPAPGFAADSDVDPAYDPYHVPALPDDAAAPIPRDASPPSPPLLALVLALALACFGVGLAVGTPAPRRRPSSAPTAARAIRMRDDARLLLLENLLYPSPRSAPRSARGCATRRPPRSASHRLRVRLRRLGRLRRVRFRRGGAGRSRRRPGAASGVISVAAPILASESSPRDRADWRTRVPPGVRRGVDGAVRRGAMATRRRTGERARTPARAAAAAWAAASAAPESPRWLIARGLERGRRAPSRTFGDGARTIPARRRRRRRRRIVCESRRRRPVPVHRRPS